MDKSLFDRTRLGALELANRIVMAPMTRSRAGEGDVPTDLHIEYYRQRASAGLIITEGTQPSESGKGYCRTPGIHSSEQTMAWKKVVAAVHAEGGKIVLQLMHCGRIAHPDNQAAGAEIVAPSAIAAKGEMYTDSLGMQAFPQPRALATPEINNVINEYRQATENAYAAGFDGVELHCASGYLPAQFLSTGTNQRKDEYGGNVENRIRFVLELVEAIAEVGGADKVGIRICPGNPFNDLYDEDPEETYSVLLQKLTGLRLAYLHIIRLIGGNIDNINLVHQHYGGNLILNDGYDFEEAQQAVRDRLGECVSFGRFFIANPNLLERFKHGRELRKFDPATLYTPGAKGYTDYET